MRGDETCGKLAYFSIDHRITLIVGTAIAAEKKTVGVMIWNIAYQFQAHMTRECNKRLKSTKMK